MRRGWNKKEWCEERIGRSGVKRGWDEKGWCEERRVWEGMV